MSANELGAVRSTLSVFQGTGKEAPVDPDVQRAMELLQANGYRVTGVMFDLFEANGLRGVGLLPDGREVRFWLPTDQNESPVIGCPVRLG